MIAAVTVDGLLAGAIVLTAGAWLLARTVRFFRGAARGGACGCAGAKACGGASGPTPEDLRRAAARAVARVNREGARVAR